MIRPNYFPTFSHFRTIRTIRIIPILGLVALLWSLPFCSLLGKEISFEKINYTFNDSEGLLTGLSAGFEKKYPLLLTRILQTEKFTRKGGEKLGMAEGIGTLEVNSTELEKGLLKPDSVKFYQDGSKQVVTSTWESNHLSVERTYRMIPQMPYQIEYQITLENRGQFPIQIGGESENLPAFTLRFGPLIDFPSPYLDYFELTPEGSFTLVYPKGDGDRKDFSTQGGLPGFGIKTPHYAFFLKSSISGMKHGVTEFNLISSQSKKAFSTNVSFLFTQIPTFIIPAGKKKEFQFQIYCGIKEEFSLIQAGLPALSDFGFISRTLLSILTQFHRIWPNWGMAIILLTLVIKLLLQPLTGIQTRQMAGMQKLQPLQQELREKYKDNPKKMNEELIKLFKENNVNPLGGCLPMLVQLPIFVALFTTLQNAVVLKGAPFYLWILDLSKPDPMYVFPIVVALSMKIQMAQTTPANPATGNVDPIQTAMMSWMPILMFFIAMNLPAGVLIYWMVTNVATIIQQKMTAPLIALSEKPA